MKIIGVICARYQSSRLPGKPLADIHGKPMIWWVWNAANQVPELNEVYVATDDGRIASAVHEFGGRVIMTSSDCDTPTRRVWEVSEKVKADMYVFIGGDEPQMTSETISLVIGKTVGTVEFYVTQGITELKSAPEVIDFTNVKAVANDNGDALYFSRSPLPYPRGSLNFEYKKTVGICAFSKEALDFYVSVPKSKLEVTEECDLIRFIEHHKPLKLVGIRGHFLSVDTQKDLEQVRNEIPPPPRKPIYLICYIASPFTLAHGGQRR